MKTQIISGSHRENSQSMKVATYLAKVIDQKGGSAKITDLHHGALPLWDEKVWAGDPAWKALWDPIATDLRAADSLIIVTPEYAGMASPAIKNFFLFCGGDLIAHKPTMLVSVTSSLFNGAYPIQELRGSSYKNSRPLFVPDHVIVRDAEKVLNDVDPSAKPANPTDEFTRKRIDFSVNMLSEYAKAMKAVRESTALNYKEFPFGM